MKKALDYVRKHIDMDYVNHCIVIAMEMRYPFSLVYPMVADNITALLEEYGQDNDLPEGWWREYGGINDIIEQI